MDLPTRVAVLLYPPLRANLPDTPVGACVLGLASSIALASPVAADGGASISIGMGQRGNDGYGHTDQGHHHGHRNIRHLLGHGDGRSGLVGNL